MRKWNKEEEEEEEDDVRYKRLSACIVYSYCY